MVLLGQGEDFSNSGGEGLGGEGGRRGRLVEREEGLLPVGLTGVEGREEGGEGACVLEIRGGGEPGVGSHLNLIVVQKCV